MLISALPGFAALAVGGGVLLFIPAFFVGLILFLAGGELESRRFNPHR